MNRNIRVQLLQSSEEIVAKHQTMVLALEKPRHELLAEWTAADYKVGLLHGGFGIGGETGEIVEALLENDVKGLIKELGDASFYGQLILIAVRQASEVEGFEMSQDSIAQLEPFGFEPIRDLQILQSRAMDAIKKVALYGQPMSGDEKKKVQNHETIATSIRAFLFALVLVAERYGFSADDVLEGNIAKLATRYAEGCYSDAAAASRRDELTGFAPTVENPEQAAKEIDALRALSADLKALNPSGRIERLRHAKDSDKLFDVRTGLFICPIEVFGAEFGAIVRDEVIERWQSELPDGILPDGVERKADDGLGELDPSAVCAEDHNQDGSCEACR